MDHTRLGMEFVKVGAFLYAMRYIVAALFIGPGLKSWDSRSFKASYEYVGNELTIWAVVCVFLGVCVWVLPRLWRMVGATTASPSGTAQAPPVDEDDRVFGG